MRASFEGCPVMSYRVAIAEDDARMRATIVRGLQGEGMSVPVAAGTGTDFLAGIADQPVDVAVLDIGLPDCDGRDLCLALRSRGLDLPVLFLTARDGLSDRVSGFHAGADDYLSKPFAFAELVLRVTALGRRFVQTAAPEGVVLDPVRHCVSVQHGSQQRSARLTPTEFRVLSALLSRRGEVVRRRALRSAGWPDGAFVADNTLDSYVGRVRRKLREVDAPVSVATVVGVGYRVD